jgi:predicted enzyme related to lactoylglutathione lyase
MPRVVHFEIHADDVERAVRFYTQVFGWTIERWSGGEYWMVKTGEAPSPGIDGGIMKRQGPRPPEGQPVNAYPCTVEVDNLDAYLAKVADAGGKNVVPKMPIPGVGWLAYCHDTEGNVFGMMQSDKSAAA